MSDAAQSKLLCQPHRDKGNVGRSTIVAFGELVMDGKIVDIKNRLITDDFSKILHSVNPILTGSRYNHGVLSSPIAVEPPPSVRLENETYFSIRVKRELYMINRGIAVNIKIN